MALKTSLQIAKILKVLFFLFVLVSKTGNAQNDCLDIPFEAKFSHQKLQINDTLYKLDGNHQIKFESFKFYISKIALLNNNQIVWSEENSYHLIDFEDNDTNNLCLNGIDDLDFNGIQFFLGIDSLTNVSGVFGGDLDPTKGMYWTWQSGYINFKLQGISNKCNNPKNEFQYHLGGYVAPFNCLQKVQLPVQSNKLFKIIFNLEKFIYQVDLENVNHIMSPNENAVEYAKMAASCFSIQE